MKNYQVFYWIKKNRHEYLSHMFVSADSAKDACRICKEMVKEYDRQRMDAYAERDHQREKALAGSPFSSPRFNRYARLKEREV